MLRRLWPVALGAAVATVVTGCSLSLSAASKSARAASARPGPVACPAFLVRTIQIRDHGAPKGRRYAQVFTPPGVSHPERLPVLYFLHDFLHGYPGGGDNIGGGPTAATFRAQTCAGARPFILVAPDGLCPPVI